MNWPARDPLSHRVAATPGRTALVAADGTAWSYRDLDGVVDGVAARLAEASGGDGPVGTLLDTRVAFVAVVHATLRLGRPLVALDTGLPTDTLAGQADRADLDLLVCGRDTEREAREIAACPVVSVDAPAEDGTGSVGPAVEGPDAERPPGVDPAALAPEDTAVVMFTSGTTGRPKGVRLTVGNLIASATASAFRLGVAPGNRWLCCLPMYHMGGLAPTVRCALYGTTLVVQEGFDAERTAAVIEDRGVTGVSLVPTMLRRLLEAGWEPPGALETVLVGGAATPPELVARAADRGVPVYPTYGTTETASGIATALPAEAVDHPGTVGAPLVVTEVTVVRDGEPADPGAVGEIVVDGPAVTPGYLDADRTAAATGPYGFHTGDLGYRDAAGRLYVEGRADDAITTGGETVFPAAVIEALREHPAVADAAVVGLPDEEWGERVAALVALAEDARGAEDAPDPGTLREWCRGRVADYAVPKTVAVGEIPRTASDTVDREAVRRRLGAE
jgi:O-succinylbenzoic acid--CoA ligase